MRRPLLIVLACLALLLVAGVPFLAAAHRRAAREDLAAVLRRHAAEGHGASFVDLAASAPPVDPARQRRARAWMKKPVPTKAHGQTSAWIAWRLEGEAPDAKALEGHEAFRPMAEELAALLEPGDLCLTSLGWLPADPARATFSERVGGPLPNLLAVRAACRFYAVEAGLADDPSVALDALDRLHASMDACGTLIDAMVAVAGDAMRDEAYLVLGLAGRLDDARRDAWLAEAPRGGRLTADGLRGERLRYGAPLAEDLATGGSAAEHLGLEPQDLRDIWQYRVRSYLDDARDCALVLEGMLAAEQRARGQATAAEATAAAEACAEVGPLLRMTVPNILALRGMGDRVREQHHALRAALVLAAATASAGRRPENDAEAHQWVARACPALDAAAWRYEAVGEDRIRVMQASASTPAPRQVPVAAFLRLGEGVEFRVR